MKMMIALRRVSTPMTPIAKSTALKNSDSASFSTLLPLAEHQRADDGGEQQHARHLEGEEVFVKERAGERRDRAVPRHLIGETLLGKHERRGHVRPGERA